MTWVLVICVWSYSLVINNGAIALTSVGPFSTEAACERAHNLMDTSNQGGTTTPYSWSICLPKE